LPNTSYLVSFEITEVRSSSVLYVRGGSGLYIEVQTDMTVGTHTLVVRTAADVSAGLTLRAGGGSDMDFNSVSLRELRPKEDW
jgi:hypothetical protein